jgi:acyl-CoA thioesterase-2
VQHVSESTSTAHGASFVDVLNVRQDGERSYVGLPRTDGQSHRTVVEGSQILGQAIVAAGRYAPGRRVVHASMVFMRAASTTEPLRIDLDELSSGRNFTTVAPHVRQAGKLCASGIMLLDATAPDVMRHAAAMPSTPGPDESVARDMAMPGYDTRFVGGSYTGDPNAPVGPPEIDAWIRFRDATPSDPCIHAALLANFTGNISIAAAMRPHAGIGQGQAHRTLSTAINTITLALHADVRADRWMLYRHHSTFAGDGMTHSECRVYDEHGTLLASFTVDGMVRRFAADHRTDERKSL